MKERDDKKPLEGTVQLDDAWLFNVNHNGAETSTMLYSMIETAKANGLMPFDYINHCLEQLAKSPQDLESLLPWNVDLNKS